MRQKKKYSLGVKPAVLGVRMPMPVQKGQMKIADKKKEGIKRWTRKKK